MLETSLARQMAGIVHLNVYGQGFKVTMRLLQEIEKWFTLKRRDEFVERMNSPSTQASDLVWRIQELVAVATIVLVDTKLLDTAIGQLILIQAGAKPVWGVGVDSKTSPIAPAFLRGVLYPSTPDDLVKVILEGSYVARAIQGQ